MSHRVHVRGATHLRWRVAHTLSLIVALAGAPALAQQAAPAPEPAEAGQSPEVAEEDAAGVAADASEDTGEAPTPPDAAAGVPADADDGRPTFLVTDIVVEEGVGISAEGARDALAGRFGRLKDKLDVRSLSEVKATLDQQGLNQLLGGDGEGLERLGGYVDADRVVFGRIHKVGGVTEVGVRVFNVREGAMELAMSRRVKAGASDALVLSVVDALADRLTVWALNTYGDAEPSSKFAEMKNKSIKKGAAEAAADDVAPPTPWTLLGVGGGAIAGIGLGAVGVGAALVSADPLHDALVPGIVMGLGAATFLGGMCMVVIDGIE